MVFLILDPQESEALIASQHWVIIQAHSTIHLKVRQPNLLAPTSVHCALSQNHRILELEREVSSNPHSIKHLLKPFVI